MSFSSNEAVIALGERIKQRSESLALTSEQRKAKREINTSENEKSDYFIDNFSILKKNIEKKLQNSTSVEKSQIVDYLDGLVNDIAKMQKFLNESSMFLPSFQIKVAQETINVTNDTVQDCINKLQPKKKFGFRNKRNETPKQKSVNVLNTDTTDNKNVSQTSTILNQHFREKLFFGFKDIKGETLTKTAEELKNRQLNLLNLTSCKVIALGNLSSMQVSNLKDCTVVVGPNSRSAFIKDCSNCVFVLACQQVRIHNTQDTKFYLHVTGSAIIENCENVSFGPYTLDYDEKEKHFEESGLSKDVNKWRNIEDFRWLNENEKSPNFTLIDEEDWERDWL
ncbi:Tubulin-specific chaperone C [Armadillidium nasatum]|uniref:Tubulin-specific chaperone C n=1 Tax=Armadillidium nasatum TaxID=96803 RepID=A0A5N5T2V4_9CRUS|nr:Tubulin-specific chaperone C [Armadillidium nasatum]